MGVEKILIGLNGEPVIRLMERLNADPAAGRIGVLLLNTNEDHEIRSIDPTYIVNLAKAISDEYEEIEIIFEEKSIDDIFLKKAVNAFNNGFLILKNFVSKLIEESLSIVSSTEGNPIIKLHFILDASDPSTYGFFTIFDRLVNFIETKFSIYDFKYSVFLLSLQISEYNYINLKSFLGNLPGCLTEKDKKRCKITDYGTLYIIESVNEVGYREGIDEKLSKIFIWFREYLNERLKYHEEIEELYGYEKVAKALLEQKNKEIKEVGNFHTVSFGLTATVIPERNIAEFAKNSVFKDVVNYGIDDNAEIGLEEIDLSPFDSQNQILKINLGPSGTLNVSPYSLIQLPKSHEKLMPFGSATTFVYPDEYKSYHENVVIINDENEKKLLKDGEIDRTKLKWFSEELRTEEEEVKKKIRLKVYRKIEKFFDINTHYTISNVLNKFLSHLKDSIEKIKDQNPNRINTDEKSKMEIENNESESTQNSFDGIPIISRAIEYVGIFIFALPKLFWDTFKYSLLSFLIVWIFLDNIKIFKFNFPFINLINSSIYYLKHNPLFLLVEFLYSKWLWVAFILGLIYYTLRAENKFSRVYVFFKFIQRVSLLLLIFGYYVKFNVSELEKIVFLMFSMLLLLMLSEDFSLLGETSSKFPLSKGIFFKLRCLSIGNCYPMLEDYLKRLQTQDLKENISTDPFINKDYAVVVRLFLFFILIEFTKNVIQSLAHISLLSILTIFTGSFLESIVAGLASKPFIFLVYLAIFTNLSYKLYVSERPYTKTKTLIAVSASIVIPLLLGCLTARDCSFNLLFQSKLLWILIIFIILGYIADYRFRRAYVKAIFNVLLQRKRKESAEFIKEKLLETAERIWRYTLELYEKIEKKVDLERKQLEDKLKLIETQLSRLDKEMDDIKETGLIDVDFKEKIHKFYSNIKKFNEGSISLAKNDIMQGISQEIIIPIILEMDGDRNIIDLIQNKIRILWNLIDKELEKFSIEDFLEIQRKEIKNLNRKKLEKESYPFWSIARREGLFSKAYVGEPAGLSERARRVLSSYLVNDIPIRFDTDRLPTKYGTDKNTLSVIYYRYGQVKLDDFKSKDEWKKEFEKLPFKEKIKT